MATNYVISGRSSGGITLSSGDTLSVAASGSTSGVVSASTFLGGTATATKGGSIITTTMSGNAPGLTGTATFASGTGSADVVDGWTVNVTSGGRSLRRRWPTTPLRA